MEQRAGHQHDVVPVQAELPAPAHRVDQPGVVGHRRTLGRPGGARGVEDGRHLVTLGRIGDGRVAQVARGGQRGGVDDRDGVVRGGRHPLGHRQQVPAGEDAGRPRVVDDVQDLRVREPRVDRHDRAARELPGQVDEQCVGPVAQQRGGHRSVRTRLDLAQGVGQGRDPQPHLPVRVTLRCGAEHLDGLAVRERPDVHRDEIGEGELHVCLRGRMRLIDSDVGFNYCQ